MYQLAVKVANDMEVPGNSIAGNSSAGTEIFEEACMIESDINFECTSSLSRSPMIWKYQVIALQVIVRQELKFLRRLV